MKIILLYFLVFIIVNIIISDTCIQVSRYKIKNKKISKDLKNFKILQISDLHGEEKGRKNRRIFDIVDREKPDLIVLTGDITDKKNKDLKSTYDLLRNLSKKSRVIYIFGNNEIKMKYNLVKQLGIVAKDLNVKILNNDKISIKKGKGTFNLYGINYKGNLKEGKKYSYRNNKYLKDNFGEIDESKYNVVLAHNPLNFDPLSKYGFDLVISGHVHGGVVKFFNTGILSPERKFFPKYSSGMYKDRNKGTLIVNRGLSIRPLFFRLNNRLEISVIELENG